MNKDLVIELSTTESSSSSYWLTMEQEYVSTMTEETSIADLNNMIAMVRNGDSALKYVMDACTYVEVIDTQIIITLPFYVWPYDLTMDYTLTADLGTITEQVIFSLDRSMDVIFDNDSDTELGFLFSGSFEPSMPFLSSNGDKSDAPLASVSGGTVSMPKSGYCVYRANGEARGHLYSVVMTFDKLDEEGEPQKIDSLDNNIFATWYNEEGEKQVTALSLNIPQCVSDALATCLDGSYLYDRIKCAGDECDGRDVYKVYFSTCKEDEVIGGVWVKNK